MSRPQRLPGLPYVGAARYFLTFCVRGRRPVFRKPDDADTTRTQISRTAHAEGFAVLAYCLMPDHAHYLVEGIREDSDLRRFVKQAKQASGAAYAMKHRMPLWQEGYYEHALRSDEKSRAVARYILENPLRAGLVRDARDYPHVGSDVWTVAELLASM